MLITKSSGIKITYKAEQNPGKVFSLLKHGFFLAACFFVCRSLYILDLRLSCILKFVLRFIGRYFITGYLMYCNMIYKSTFYDFIYISSCILERTDVQEVLDPTSLKRPPRLCGQIFVAVSDRIN